MVEKKSSLSVHGKNDTNSLCFNIVDGTSFYYGYSVWLIFDADSKNVSAHEFLDVFSVIFIFG